jgi:hypothetical protein
MDKNIKFGTEEFAAKIVQDMFKNITHGDMLQETQERHLALGARMAFITFFTSINPHFDRVRFCEACEYILPIY